jgi:hypothetical protein
MPVFISKLSPEQWAEVRRLRAKGASFADLGRRFGVTASCISQCARKQGWASADSVAGAARPAGARARVPSPATANIRNRLALRLYRIIEIQISTLELRMTKDLEAQQQALDAGEPPPPIEDRRESFAALIEQINHVTEMTSEPASAANGGRKSINPELTALSDEIDPAALAEASEKDAKRARLAEQLAKAVGPA